MKWYVVFLLIILCNASYHSQDTKTVHRLSATDTFYSRPKISWKVNKRLDEKGKLIGYDSSYVWIYPDKAQYVKVDSVRNEFKEQFDQRFQTILSRAFGASVWSDTLFYRNLIRPDYFIHKWKNNDFDIRKLMQQMDSARSVFLQQQYPGITSPLRKY